MKFFNRIDTFLLNEIYKIKFMKRRNIVFMRLYIFTTPFILKNWDYIA